MKNFLELAEKRQSCRSFNGKNISKDKLTQLIEIARVAPSACNGQPWHFIVVQDQEKLLKMTKGMQKFNEKAGAFIVILEEKSNLTSNVGGKIKKTRFPPMDIGIVATYLSLAATDMGIENCMIGWFNEKNIKQVLNIPKKKRVRLIISLGYSDDNNLRDKKRKPLDEILSYDE